MARMAQQKRRLYEMCAMAIVERRADLDGAARVGFDIELPILSVSRAAEITGVHPQTLRQYDRIGLVVPRRTEGGARRYSLRDVDHLIQAQRLSQDEGINLSGVMRILELEEQNRELRRELDQLKYDGISVFTADAAGGITQTRQSRRARHWRHRDARDKRALPSGEASESKSVVLWRR